MNKKTIFVGKIENYELIPGPETQGFAIFFDKPFDIKLITEWVGRKTKITFEEPD